MVVIDKTFEEGYVRPLGRGVRLGDKPLEEIIEEAIPAECYSLTGGSVLKGIHLIVRIEEVEKG